MHCPARAGRSIPTRSSSARSPKRGVASAEARTASRLRPSIFNSARDAFLIAIGDDLYAYNISTQTATRLTDSAGAKVEATFSPDGRSVAFIKNNNIFVAEHRRHR